MRQTLPIDRRRGKPWFRGKLRQHSPWTFRVTLRCIHPNNIHGNQIRNLGIWPTLRIQVDKLYKYKYIYIYLNLNRQNFNTFAKVPYWISPSKVFWVNMPVVQGWWYMFPLNNPQTGGLQYNHLQLPKVLFCSILQQKNASSQTLAVNDHLGKYFPWHCWKNFTKAAALQLRCTSLKHGEGIEGI